jgi:hypothetical protein
VPTEPRHPPSSTPVSKHGTEKNIQSGDPLDDSLEYSTDSETTLVGLSILAAADLLHSSGGSVPVGSPILDEQDLMNSSSESLFDSSAGSMETSVVAAVDSSSAVAMDTSDTAALADHDPDAEDAESVPGEFGNAEAEEVNIADGSVDFAGDADDDTSVDSFNPTIPTPTFPTVVKVQRRGGRVNKEYDLPRGVTFFEGRGKYRVQLYRKDKNARVYLGYFVELDMALAAYRFATHIMKKLPNINNKDLQHYVKRRLSKVQARQP